MFTLLQISSFFIHGCFFRIRTFALSSFHFIACRSKKNTLCLFHTEMVIHVILLTGSHSCPNYEMTYTEKAPFCHYSCRQRSAFSLAGLQCHDRYIAGYSCPENTIWDETTNKCVDETSCDCYHLDDVTVNGEVYEEGCMRW